MAKIIIITLALFSFNLSGDVLAASLYDTVKKGNRLYQDGKFDEALKTYVDGQIEHADDLALKYNIAASHYKTKNYDEAVKGYLDIAASAKDAGLQEKSLYNCGNALYQQGKLEEAIEYYKKALGLNPDDQDAKHNLEFVQEELKKRKSEAKKTEQKQQQEQQQQKQDGKQQQQSQQQQQGQQGPQQNQDKQQQQQAQQQGEKQEEQKTAQQKQQQEQKEQQQTQGKLGTADKKEGEKQDEAQAVPQQARQMTKEEAQQLLNSIEENRGKFAKKKAQEEAAGQYRPEKDW
jgi:Ca-activated chloride channel family protein